ncbi:MAG TPA: hypothetical protein VK619_04660 [Pyrinomonadaceae bacterium]|nr:hypothetical protein [Pyrinomonadaceae bacterium]
MTEEEMRSKMEFIIDQQAHFSADIQQLKELHMHAEVRLTKAEERMTRLENIVVRFANHTEERLVTLTERMESGFAVVNEKMAALAESQSHTDRRLDTLIDIIMQERNGRAKS